MVEQIRGVTYIEEFGASSASYVSPQMEALVGWPPEEWAKDPELFGKVLHPEDRDRVLTAFAETLLQFATIGRHDKNTDCIGKFAFDLRRTLHINIQQQIASVLLSLL